MGLQHIASQAEGTPSVVPSRSGPSSGTWSAGTEPLSVLLIEDNDADAYILRRTLLRIEAPVQIEHVQTKARAIRALGLTTPDILLLDMNLPDSSGPQAIAELRTLAPSAAILVLTALHDQTVAQAALRLGAHDYIIKGSFDGEGLLRAIRFAVERARSERLRNRLLHDNRLASIGNLAAGVVHEIANPLSFISQNVEALIDALDKNEIDKSQFRESLTDVQLGVERIQSITRSLGSFSRLEAEELELVDVSEVARGAAKIVANQIKHHAEFITNLPASSRVSGNAGQLSQVLVNLLVNADHATQQAQDSDNQVRFWISEDNQNVTLTVEDTGGGVPDSLRKKIFEPFFTTKKRDVGTGLGLTLCREMVEKMGGTLQVSCSAEGGARFEVRLPSTQCSSDVLAAPTTVANDVQISRRARVLIVDDDPLVLKGYRRILKNEHDVTCANSAKEALALLDRNMEFTLILCDLMMPEMDGQDLYETIQQRHPQAATRLIFASGGAFTQRTREFVESLGAQVLPKPLSRATLLNLLADQLNIE